ncbi:uracil-xanthine permease family protein [Biostraticola tofi]|uniref:NCS2 family nucleobase:cation symporter-2 n=1 Tax=Biostraticola tofi TaxID=466109 RepID=A0A4R3YQN1_9GAMM|nr:solute carrier family 23 protein [Biostraticola tofi]TCV95235.1 NCS2 family nucleobase:cation symporter-2 [Biostraticola tofi]
MEKSSFEGTLIARPDDRLTTGKAAVLGLQHVLAMDVYVVPFIIASVLTLSVADSASLIQSAFIASGIATLIQTRFCMKLPIAQGPSYIPLGAVLAIAFTAGGGISGLSTLFGALLPGAVLMVLLGSLGVFHRIIRQLVPPLVGGTIILVVGIALLPIALKSNVFTVYGTGSINTNVLLASVSAVLLVTSMMLGVRLAGRGVWLRLCSVLIALAGGCAVASILGLFSLDAVAQASWLTLPRIALLDYSLTFSWQAMLTFVVIYIVLMAETTGTWFAVGAVIDQPITDRQLDRGTVGEGLGCVVSALVGSTPVTGYSSNAGVIAITGIASRSAFIAAGLILVLFGLIGKLSAIIASIPAAVIGGVFAILCTSIAMNGIRVIRHSPFTERNMLIAGLPIIFAFFANLAPPEYIQTLPVMVQYVLGSSVAVGAMAAIVLNQLIPNTSK